MSAEAQQLDSLKTTAVDSLLYQSKLDSLQKLNLTKTVIDSILSTTSWASFKSSELSLDTLGLIGTLKRPRQIDSLLQERGQWDKSQKKLTKLDSLGKGRSLSLPDSLNISDKLREKLTSYSSDSLLQGRSLDLEDRQKKLLSAKDSLGLLDKIPNIDSLGIVQKLQSLSELPDKAIDSLQQASKSRIDQLRKPKKADSLLSKLPTDKLNKKIAGSLNEFSEKSESLTNVNGDQSKITSMTDKLPSVSHLDTGELEKVGNISEPLSTIGIVDIDLPASSGISLKADKLPNVESPLKELAGQVDGNILKDRVNDLTKGTDLPSIDKLSEIGDLTKKTKLPDVPSVDDLGIDELSKAKEYSGELSKLSEQADKLKDINIDQLQSDEVEKLAEEQLKNVAGVEQIEKNVKAFEETRELPNRYKTQLEQYQKKNKLKEELRNKAMQIGNNHFEGKSEELKTSIKSLDKYKNKYESVENVKDLSKIRTNAMKGKPFRERLTLGAYIQIQGSPRTAVDISPQIGYRLSGLFTWGIGATYRIYFDSDALSANIDDKVHGYRTYLNANVYKGFYLHGEYESIKTHVPNLISTSQDAGERLWVDGVLLGIGKQYSITRSIKGYAQVLHNFTYVLGESPYSKKIVFRFGIEGSFRKKATKD